MYRATSHIEIPYEGGVLPGLRLPAKTEKATIVAHGGYDSFIEEWLPFLQPMTDVGYTVIAFDGPGQGGALRRGIYLTLEWEKPAAALLDHFNLDAVDWIGASCGGYMALRAAAFEPRIKHVVAFPATYWGMDMLLKQLTPGQRRRLVSLFHAGKREEAEALLASSPIRPRTPTPTSPGRSPKECTSPGPPIRGTCWFISPRLRSTASCRT